MFATATPSPSSVERGEYGNGVVNPYEAINGQLTDASPAPLPVLIRPDVARDAAWVRSRNVALAGAGAAILAVTIVLAIAVAIPRGRRRFWRPALAAPPPSAAEPAEPSPPRQLFDDR
jgi:hypothetical protein